MCAPFSRTFIDGLILFLDTAPMHPPPVQLESERHFSRVSAERTTFSFPPAHQPTWSASPSISDPQAGHSPSSASEASSEANGNDDNAGSQKGKRRRLDLNEAEDSTGKSRNPRKTAVACNFCRGTYPVARNRLKAYNKCTDRPETSMQRRQALLF